MKATVKQVFFNIELLNPYTSDVSSLGSIITEQSRQVSDMVYREVLSNVSEDSLAYKILTGSTTYSEKQLWVIAYELLKNDTYVTQLGAEIAQREVRSNARKQASKDKLKDNKASTQNILDYIKANGKLLKDYYNFLKSSKQYSREFFLKKFTAESANEFINS